MAKPKAAPPFDLERSLVALVEAIRARGFLKTAELKKFMVPPERQGEVLERLAAEGFEPMASGVRVPLRLQLETLLQQRGVLAWPPGKLLKGGSPKEYKALVLDLARAGELHLLVRGRAEAVAGREAAVLDREEMQTLRPLALAVQKALKARPLPRTLLRADLREVLLDLLQPGEAPEPALVERLVRECAGRLEADRPLCFVPDLVLECLQDHSLARIHAALFQAVRQGRLELRPESGVHRLSGLELALCPPGLQGTRLSWARPLEPRP